MRLNCDLGERCGKDSSADEAVMPYVDQASIACGFHAGDPLTMRRTLALAAQHGVQVGAHPAYPDRSGFGRHSMQLSPGEIGAILHYQIAALDGMAHSAGMSLDYVKPHGALYHDMMTKPEVRRAIFEAMADYHRDLALMVQATNEAGTLDAQAQDEGITLLFEAFADRAYNDDGSLVPRGQAGAVLDRDGMLAQVAQLHRDQSVTSVGGNTLSLRIDSVCVHGDNPEAVAAIRAIREQIDGG